MFGMPLYSIRFHGMVHAWVGQIVTFGQYGVPACPWAIFEPGNRSRRVKLESRTSLLFGSLGGLGTPTALVARFILTLPWHTTS